MHVLRDSILGFCTNKILEYLSSLNEKVTEMTRLLEKLIQIFVNSELGSTKTVNRKWTGEREVKCGGESSTDDLTWLAVFMFFASVSSLVSRMEKCGMAHGSTVRMIYNLYPVWNVTWILKKIPCHFMSQIGGTLVESTQNSMSIPCHLSRFYLFFMLEHDMDFGQVQVMEFSWRLLRKW